MVVENDTEDERPVGAIDVIKAGKIDLVINIPEGSRKGARTPEVTEGVRDRASKGLAIQRTPKGGACVRNRLGMGGQRSLQRLLTPKKRLFLNP